MNNTLFTILLSLFFTSLTASGKSEEWDVLKGLSRIYVKSVNLLSKKYGCNSLEEALPEMYKPILSLSQQIINNAEEFNMEIAFIMFEESERKFLNDNLLNRKSLPTILKAHSYICDEQFNELKNLLRKENLLYKDTSVLESYNIQLSQMILEITDGISLYAIMNKIGKLMRDNDFSRARQTSDNCLVQAPNS
ncbi:MAG: hypothetical protein OXE99_00400, partial [Cellvibrionales bacterium]|nr:hypothetical protein [Cellvibrionales bacterium]